MEFVPSIELNCFRLAAEYADFKQYKTYIPYGSNVQALLPELGLKSMYSFCDPVISLLTFSGMVVYRF